MEYYTKAYNHMEEGKKPTAEEADLLMENTMAHKRSE
jgi:hypothetical protein